MSTKTQNKKKYIYLALFILLGSLLLLTAAIIFLRPDLLIVLKPWVLSAAKAIGDVFISLTNSLTNTIIPSLPNLFAFAMPVKEIAFGSAALGVAVGIGYAIKRLATKNKKQSQSSTPPTPQQTTNSQKKESTSRLPDWFLEIQKKRVEIQKKSVEIHTKSVEILKTHKELLKEAEEQLKETAERAKKTDEQLKRAEERAKKTEELIAWQQEQRARHEEQMARHQEQMAQIDAVIEKNKQRQRELMQQLEQARQRQQAVRQHNFQLRVERLNNELGRLLLEAAAVESRNKAHEAEYHTRHNRFNDSIRKLLLTVNLTPAEEMELATFVCPISLDYMQAPVIAPDKQRYDLWYLKLAYYAGYRTCPLVPSVPLPDPDTLPRDAMMQARMRTLLENLQQRERVISGNVTTLFATPPPAGLESGNVGSTCQPVKR